MGSIVHRSVPTNLKWFPTCSHAHAMFQDRFKDVQVGSRWFSTLYILSPNFHSPASALAAPILSGNNHTKTALSLLGLICLIHSENGKTKVLYFPKRLSVPNRLSA